MNLRKRTSITGIAIGLAFSTAIGQAQVLPGGVSPSDIGRPPTDTWLTYHGDYTGQRFSTLDQINASNVRGLAQAWTYRLNTSAEGALIGANPQAPPPAAAGSGGGGNIKSVPLLHNGSLFFTSPNHVWSVNARTGRENWHFLWRPKGGFTIGNRGVALWGNNLYTLTPDNFLLALDSATGREVWKRQVSNVNQDYWTTSSPTVIKNHLIYGVGTDRYDFPAFLESRNALTGDVEWRWNVTPGPGEPGFETWPNERAARNGGGTPWVPGTYDKEQNLYIFGTGNPQAVLDGRGRRGDNLYTGSIVAINPDTGKLKWHFQVAPHDIHDWDASVTPVLFDAPINGRPRKLVAVANRNGYYFLLDRVSGKALVTAPLVEGLNWSSRQRASGQRENDPAKDTSIGGNYIQPNTNGVANWLPPTYSPHTGLFYTGVTQSHSIFYLAYTGPNPRGWSAVEKGLGVLASSIQAMDPKTGKIVWKQELARTPNPAYGLMGLISTAGGLVFGNDGGGDFVAYDAKTGTPLWHSPIGNPSNAPMTYMLDGKQYVVTGVGPNLHAFALP